MRKEQNVIKSVLVILIFSLSGQLYCQKKINGIYNRLMLNQEHYDYFNFSEKGIFEYHSGASLGDKEFGKGHYFIKNDSLILNYDLTELKEESYFKAKKYYNNKDSITISLTIYDFKNNPINNLGIYTFPKYKSTESNIKGKAVLRIKRQKTK